MKGHMNTTLLDIGMDDSQPWRRKHLAAVALNYRKARFFDYAYPRLEALLGAATQNLADFCWEQLRFSDPLVWASSLCRRNRKGSVLEHRANVLPGAILPAGL